MEDSCAQALNPGTELYPCEMLSYCLLVGVILQVNKIKTSATQDCMSNTALAIREIFMLTPTELRVTTVVWLYPSSETSNFGFRRYLPIIIFEIPLLYVSTFMKIGNLRKRTEH